MLTKQPWQSVVFIFKSVNRFCSQFPLVNPVLSENYKSKLPIR